MASPPTLGTGVELAALHPITKRKNTEHAVPVETVAALLGAAARAVPEAVALSSDCDQISYRELNGRANQLAHLLIRMGAGPEQTVGVALPRSAEAAIAMVAVIKTGAAYLPLNPDYPKTRIAYMVADAAPAAVVTSAGVGPTADDLPTTRMLPLDEAALRACPETDPTNLDRSYPLDASHTLYVIYTSGSTGKPKGVSMPGAALMNLLAWHRDRFATGPGVRTANLCAIGFDMGMHEVLGALVHGKCLMVPTEDVRRDPIQLTGWLDRHDVHQLFLPNVLIQSLCEAAAVTAADLGGLTDIVQSGEPLILSPALQAFLRKRPNLRIHNHYGATEMQDVTTWSIGDSTRPTLGTPLWNTTVYILDDDLRPVPDGNAGNLHVAGAGLARGYLGQPGITADRFLPDPFGEPGLRMYHTGDVAMWNAEGELEYLGRSDNQIKVNGFRVELGEIETLLRARDDVAQALAVPRQDTGTRNRLFAYVVLEPGARSEAGSIRADLARALPAHMVPFAVVVLDEFPSSINGKIDLQALPVPKTRAVGGDIAWTRAQQCLLDAFAETLGVTNAGLTENFFDIGGDSVAAMRLVIRVRQQGLVITIPQVFELGTPRLLAEVASDVGAAPSVMAMGPLLCLHHRQLNRLRSALPDLERILPVTSVQRGLLFHQLAASSEADVYIEQLRLTVGGPLDGPALCAAFQAVLDRHAHLRACFFAADLPEPVQVIGKKVAVPWQSTDLSPRSPAAAAEHATGLAAESRRRAFDVSNPPLLRVHLIKLPSDRYCLVIDYHHLLVDGWSLTLLIRELFGHYQGKRDLLPAPCADDWFRALKARDESSAMAAWQSALRGIADPTALAMTPEGPSVESARYDIALSLEATERLTRMTRRHRLTINTVVQALWGILLQAETGSSDVVFGTVVSGRIPEVADVQHIVGMLVNTVPVAVRGGQDDEPALTLFRRLQSEQLLLAPHQHVGLGAIHRLLGWSREFDTLLVFENTDLQLDTKAAGFDIVDVWHSDDTHYAVSVLVTPGEHIRITLTYRRQLIAPARIHRLATGLTELLTTVGAEPNRQVSSLRLAAVPGRVPRAPDVR